MHPSLSILIPTYNRRRDLICNLTLLSECIKKLPCSQLITVIVSDNNSADDTWASLLEFQSRAQFPLEIYRNQTNLGLEENVLAVLARAASEYIMFLGDDDYLPPDYIHDVIQMIFSYSDLGAVIPGNTALSADGVKTPVRFASFRQKTYYPGFASVLQNSGFGHQLSGLVLYRPNLLNSYLSRPEHRNIYPFIYMLALCCESRRVIYSPSHQVLITQSNNKDWAYDQAGLLGDVFHNYYSLYGPNSLKASLACLVFAVKSHNRLRLHLGLNHAIETYRFMLRSYYLPAPTIFILPLMFLLCAFKTCLKNIKSHSFA